MWDSNPYSKLLSNNNSGLLKVGCRINEHKVADILVDTGAKVNCIDLNLVKDLSNVQMRENGTNLVVAANKSKLKVRGSVMLKIEFQGEARNVEETQIRHTSEFDKVSLKRNLKTVWGQKQSHIEFLVVEDLSTIARISIN
jgi:hypothetical protein